MSHPQEEILNEFRYAIARLVPLTPKDIQDEALQLADDLEANDATTAEQIRQALVYIGRKEFPYRKAYRELCAGDEEVRMQNIVLQKLDDAIKAELTPVTEYGVHIVDFMKSSQYDALNDHARIALDNAVREAHDIVNRQCDERAASRAESYQSLVTRFTEEAQHIQACIEVLKDMAHRDPRFQEEILAKAREFENGFSILEHDPSQDAVEQEIVHWAGVLGGVEDEDGAVE